MNITPDDLIRGAMTLKDEATMLGLDLATRGQPALTYGTQHATQRRESLERCAAYLEEQAKQAVAA